MCQFTAVKAAVVLGLAAYALSGCGPWVQVGGPYRYSPHPVDPAGFQVILPAEWRRATFIEDSLLLTRDGVSLQYIRIEQVAVGDELAYTKKRFARGMSPLDVAEVELDEARSDQTAKQFELLANVPFQVGGFPGFKLVYTFKTVNGLRLKRVHFGVLVRTWVYRVQYQAAARFYFDKDLATFERVQESFRVTDKGS